MGFRKGCDFLVLLLCHQARTGLGGVGRLWRRREAATGIEYALVIGGISIAILATIFALGNGLSGLFEEVVAVFDECVGSGTANDQGLSRGQGKGCGQQ